MSAQDSVSRVTAPSGRGVSQARAPEGIEGRGRASDARSCLHAAFHPAEIRGVAGWSASSRARARSIWPGSMESANAISWGSTFGPEDFFVNTVGRDEHAIRAYIRNQEKEDQRLEQMNLWRWQAAFGRLQIRGAASATPS